MFSLYTGSYMVSTSLVDMADSPVLLFYDFNPQIIVRKYDIKSH